MHAFVARLGQHFRYLTQTVTKTVTRGVSKSGDLA